MPEEAFPLSVDLDRAANTLEIEWDDGHRSHLEGARLRWACPCAECQGEMGSPGRLAHERDLPEPELRLADVGLIGQYALSISFESGHSTGIYTFARLRQM